MLSIGLLLGVVAILLYHGVNNSLSEEDKQYIPLYLNDINPLPEKPSYEDEINFIILVQQSVLRIAPEEKGLPFGQKRDLKELYEAKSGLCYDRSRVIEKILRYSGFKTRHISVYSTKKTRSSIKSIITSGVQSHAITEVLTKNGWLIVDSNYPWISINTNMQPISIKDMKLSIDNSAPILWNKVPPTIIYVEPFTYVYGLYSRHGYFYPPYNFFPDIHYGEFIQNI